MTEYEWHVLRDHAIEQFDGDTPRAELEQKILDVFERNPAMVAKAVDRIASKFKAGQVRSPWAVLAIDVTQTGSPVRLVTAVDTTSREKRIARAEQWVKAAGVHFDRESEVVAHLFGDRGLLEDWHEDEQLVARMIGLWVEARPTGERLEEEAVEAAEEWKRYKARVVELAKEHLADPDAKQPAAEVGEALVARAEL